MRLNLGEGNHPVPGYVGVDRKYGQEIYPLAYTDSSIAEIRASHCLEHFGHQEVEHVLRDWMRALEPGGVLKIAVPDFAKVSQWYQEGREDLALQSFVVGGQIDEGDYHKSIFDAHLLTERMKQVGLVDIKPWVSEIEDNASWEVTLNLQGTKPAAENWPSAKAYNRYSQYGEDGILEAIFAKIGTTNRYCVDVGAADGLLFSNVRQFIEQGWTGLLIESDEDRFNKLAGGLGSQFQGVRCINERVETHGEDSLDRLLERADAPKEPDLLSIDIDGQDYYVWNSLLRFSPRVVVVEYDPEVDPMFIPPLGGKGQAGWNAMTYVASARGYICIARTRTNLICLRRDIIDGNGMQVVMEEPCQKQSEAPTEPVRNASQLLSQLPANSENTLGVAEDKPVQITAVISVPRLGFNDNWHSTIRALIALRIKVEMVTGVFWGQCLTRGIEKAIANGAEIILTIDYDTVFDTQHVVKVCQLLADHPEYDAIVPIQVKRESNQMLFGLNGSRDFTQALTPISLGHFGLTAIDANAFARMGKPWFHDQPSPTGDWGDGRVDCDIHFWKQFTQAGLKIGLANEVRIGHLELMVTWADKQFQVIHQSISDYRANGQPKECGGEMGVEILPSNGRAYPCTQPRLDVGEPMNLHPNQETAEACCYAPV